VLDERDELVHAAVEAAARWRREHPGWMAPLEELHGQVAAAVGHLLDAGLVVPAGAMESPARS
jgi:hypothetical protein